MSPGESVHTGYESGDIHLLRYWLTIWKRRRLLAAVVSLSMVLAAIISFLMTPIFEARTTLMAVEPSANRFSAILGTLQNMPYLGGAVGGAFGKTATDKLMSILKSRTVAEDVIRKLNLIPVLFGKEGQEKGKLWGKSKPPTMEDALEILRENMLDIKDDRKGLIKISVEHESPELAAAIANEYTAALHRFLNSNSISLAKRNRIFLDKQLEMTKAELQTAEEGLKTYQTSKKVVAIDAQAEGAIKALAELKTLIVSREVQLGAMREYATAAHPDIRRTEDELRELRSQLRQMEVGPSRPVPGDSNGGLITLKEAPTLGLQYVRFKRDVLIQEKVFELLTQQYELAKIEEAKDEITFQVIDPATPPEYRIRPKRTLNVILAGLVSLFVGLFAVFSWEYIRKIKAGPVTSG